jgi:hypothetical protein
VAGAPTWPSAIAMAGGDLDGDDLEDMVTVTAAGTLHFHRNLGGTQINGCHFAPDVVVDNFLSAYPISPPFVNYWFPRAQVVDLDLDGFNDILIAGGPNDRWSGMAMPGFVGYYRGDGAGGFQATRYDLSGSVVDVEFADLDNNGTPDHLVVLMESGGVGAFSYDIVHLEVQQADLIAAGYPQNIGPGRRVALEMADVIGDSNTDYIVAQVSVYGSSISSDVYYFQGDGTGQYISSAWGVLSLPVGPIGYGNFVASLEVGDFDQDSSLDIAMLRGFVQPPANTASAASFADAEVLVAMGPNVTTAPVESIPLPGYFLYSSTSTPHFALLPLSALPDGLRAIDLGRDSSPDFLVGGLRSSNPSAAPLLVTLRNQTPPAIGDACFEKIGEPSGGVPSRLARIGFEGGRPAPGNPNFACTIQNVQGGSIVGLMWGSYPAPNLFDLFGIDFHIGPELFGYPAVATGAHENDGFYSYPLPIPPVPALVGDVGCFQYNYYDPVAGAFGGTQATRLSIGN